VIINMSTTMTPRLPSGPCAILSRIGFAVIAFLAFTGNAMAGRYGSPPEHTDDVIDEDTMRAVALICAAHY
jgi:hypothetical protein